MARLAQTSIRFRHYEIGPERFERLSLEIDALAARVARQIYGPSVEVDVVIVAGSLLITITVLGGILWGTYDAISKYPDFKDGLGKLVKDAKHYGSAIVEEVLKVTGQKKPDSVAKRDMTPGRISRIIEKLEGVRDLEKHAPKRVVQDELQQISRDVQAIERDLVPQELKQIDEELGSRGLPPLEKLPRPVVREERGAAAGEREGPARPQKPKRQKLRHHNRFVVGEESPRLPKSRP
jgi:hypothetical protein